MIWISIHDGMPDDGENILVANEGAVIAVMAIFRSKECKFEVQNYPGTYDRIYLSYYGNVTHWMKLPDLP